MKYIKSILLLFCYIALFGIVAANEEEEDGQIEPGYNFWTNISIWGKNTLWIDWENVHDLFSGAWVYNVPLNFPKWPKNITVDIGLSYNSYSSNAFTPYGYAWNMNIPVIQRSSKRWVADMYKHNDFSIFWEDLVLVDISQWLYKSKKVSDRSLYYFQNGQWKVIDERGNTYFYGIYENSKLFDPSDENKVYAWYLSKIVDLRGNQLLYSYFKDHNQVYIDEISYANGLYKIDFNYLSKTRSLSSYKASFEVKTTKLLQDIRFIADNQEVKKYTLDYDDTTHVFSHLVSIEESNEDEIFQKYHFTYGTGANNHLLTSISRNTGLRINFSYKPSVFYADENGKKLNPDLPFNMKTLHEIRYKDAVSWNELIEKYEYANGAFYFDSQDLYGRQYAGFGKVTKTDSLWEKEVSYFHQWANSLNFPELGEYEDHISKKWEIYRHEIYDSQGEKVKTSITKWENHDIGGRWKVLKTSQLIHLSEWSEEVAHATGYEYDALWFLTKEIYHGRVSLDSGAGDFTDIWSDTFSQTYSYAQNIDKNLFGFISSKAVYDEAENLVSKVEWLYDKQDLWIVSFGDMTLQKAYIDAQNYIEDSYNYDARWLLISQIDGEGNETRYTYDTYGIYPSSITNPKGFQIWYTYDYNVWKISEISDYNGGKIRYGYDAIWRIISEKFDNGENVFTKNTWSHNSTELPNSSNQTVYFDTQGNQYQEIYAYLDASGNIKQTKRSFENTYITQSNTYDMKGNKTYSSYPYYDDTVAYNMPSVSLEAWKVMEYDSLNRLIKITDVSWDVTYNYGNLDFTLTNQLGNSHDYNYDVFWNLISVTEPGNNVTQYNYNSLGLLTKISDAADNTRTIEYDFLWRKIAIDDLHSPDDTQFGTRYYSYDNLGNILKYTTLEWENIMYEYDSLGRVIKTSLPDGENITYSYDSGIYGKWLLSGILRQWYSEEYDYDIFWNKTSFTSSYWSKAYTLQYNYNLAWQEISITYPDDKTLEYSYNSWVLKNAIYDGNELLSHVEYNPVGRIVSMDYANGAKVRNVYDNEHGYRLNRKWVLLWENQYGLTDYLYDAVGNIVTLTENGSIPAFKKEVNYNYDSLNRLLQAEYVWDSVIAYTYDTVGNILSQTWKGNYNYQDTGYSNPHAVTSIWTDTFSYDRNGNVISDKNGNYSFNSLDEQRGFTTHSGATTSYLYDANGVRVQKSWSWMLSRYITKEFEVREEASGSGAELAQTKYIFFGNMRLASVKAKNGDEKYVYHHEDHLWGGNIDMDSDGNIVQIVDYLPFWKVRERENTDWYENPYLFTWKEQDSESDLQYFEARYYDNDIWRFRSIDRVFWEVWSTRRAEEWLMEPQRFNAYSYVWNNPLIRTDDSWEWWDVAVDSAMASWGIAFGKITGKEHYVIWGQNMLRDTLNPKNALNPVKKVKKVQKAADAGKKVIKKVNTKSPSAKEKLNDKLSKQEAIKNGTIEVPKERIWDDKYKINNIPSYDKKSYTHESLDWSRTRIHYMENSTTWNIKDIKIKWKSIPSNYKK